MNSICYKCKSKINRNDHWYGLHENCFIEWFKLSSLDRLQNLAARYQTEQPSIAGTKNSTFFHGMFRKYSCTLNDISYILKVEEPEFRELPATEYLCNQIYKMLGLNIPPFFLINLEEDVSCFVTENFMSNFQESNLVHMYHLLASHERYDCETLVQIIADKTGLLSAQEDFIYLTLADSLIGNHDRHGRNLGFVQSSQGHQLAPFYDNVSYVGTEIDSLLEADHQPSGKIETAASSEPTLADYVKEWDRLGFNYVVESFRKACSIDKIAVLIASSCLTNKRQQALFRLIQKRSNELWD